MRLSAPFARWWPIRNTRHSSSRQANVEYLRKDGKTVTIPAVTVLERSDNLVKSLRIYFDVAPVYA